MHDYFFQMFLIFNVPLILLQKRLQQFEQTLSISPEDTNALEVSVDSINWYLWLSYESVLYGFNFNTQCTHVDYRRHELLFLEFVPFYIFFELHNVSSLALLSLVLIYKKYITYPTCILDKILLFCPFCLTSGKIFGSIFCSLFVNSPNVHWVQLFFLLSFRELQWHHLN